MSKFAGLIVFLNLIASANAIALAASPSAAPTNLTAIALSASEIRLYWQDNSNNENGFKIERSSQASGPFIQIGTIGANALTCKNINLAPSTTYYYRIRAYNVSGNSEYSNIASATTRDITPPTGSIKINNGVNFTNSIQVTLNLSAQDNPGGAGISQMAFSNDNVNWSNPVAFAYSMAWALSARDGTKTVYVKYGDRAGNWSLVYSASILLDTTPPTGTIKTNRYTTSQQITLNLQAQDYSGGSGVSQMSFSNDGSSWTNPENYSVTKNWPLPSGNGRKTVYVKFSDAAGNWSASVPCAIILDNTAPAAPLVTDDGASTEDASQLHCAWAASDPESEITEYQYRINEGSPNTNTIINWTTIGTSSEITKTGLNLIPGKTYYFSVKAKNGAGLWSEIGSSNGITVTQAADTIPPTGSIKVSIGNNPSSGDNPFTSTTSVIMQLEAHDNPGGSGVSQMRFSNDNYGWTAPENYASTRNWTLPPGDGPKTIYVKYSDKAGNWSSAFSYTITLDTTAPIAPVVTDDGAYAAANTGKLHCSWSCQDLDSGITEYQFKISQDSPSGTVIVNWSSRQRNYTEVTQTGLQLIVGKVYYFSVKAKNGSGLWSEIGSSDGITIIQSTPPTGSIKINNGSFYATSAQVTLNLEAKDTNGNGVSQMRFSNNGSTWSDPENYTTTKTWTLSEGDGTKTVLAQFSDNFGTWSGSFQSNVILDTTIPTVLIKINNNALYTNSAQVDLDLTAQEERDGTGLSQMSFSNDNANWSTPENYAYTKTWALSARDGVKTVYVKFSDRAGNWSRISSASILLDTSAPTGSIKTNNYSASPQVTLNLQAQDAPEGSGILQMRLSNNNSNWTAPETYTTTRNWTLSAGNGAKKVYVKFSDAAGNWSDPYSCAVVMDNTAPTMPQVTDDGVSTSNATQLHCTWTASDQESGIIEHQYKILENSPFGAVVIDWTPAGTSTEITKAGISLKTGTAYYFSVKAKNGAGLWSEVGHSDGITVVNSAPPVPANFSATALSSSEISLSWQDNSNNEEEFHIERARTQAGPFSLIDVRPANSIACVNSGLQARTTYYYRIKAHNNAGESAYSTVASATTLAPLPAPEICSFNPPDSTPFTEGDIITISACVKFSGPDKENQILVDGQVLKSWFAPTGTCACATPANSFSYLWQTALGNNGYHTIEIQARYAGSDTVSLKTTVFIYRRPPGPPAQQYATF